MGTDKSALGARGEDRAVDYLVSLGCEIIERNYHCKQGEIDIIAQDGEDLVFVEVKTRRNNQYGAPSEAVDSRKRRKLIKSGIQYLVDREMDEVCCRFDVMEVYFINGQPIKVEHIKGAFSVE